KETQQLLAAGRDSILCRADVAVGADRDRLVEAVLARWGRIDVLVNNAGITSLGRRDILEANEETWDTVLDINLKAPFFLSQRVGREMIRLKDKDAPADYQPAMVNIGSISAFAFALNRGDYCISKAGLGIVTQLFAWRLADH